MAELFGSINGMPWQEAIAHTAEVQDELDKLAKPMAATAKAILNTAENRTGKAEIHLVKGDIDRSIILDDSGDWRGAMTIEYGREGDDDGKGRMEGLWPLHRATGLRGGG